MVQIAHFHSQFRVDLFNFNTEPTTCSVGYKTAMYILHTAENIHIFLNMINLIICPLFLLLPSIHIFQSCDNIKTTKNKLKIQHGSPVYCIMSVNNLISSSSLSPLLPPLPPLFLPFLIELIVSNLHLFQNGQNKNQTNLPTFSDKVEIFY